VGEPVTNLGRWAPWYAEAEEPRAYVGTDDELKVTYHRAAEWLWGLAVEDWGCGLGWFKLLHDGPYLGIDGTRSQFCDVHADLVTYRSETPGLLLRHVLEHNHEWQKILDNAVASFTERMCLILFTPLAEVTQVIADDVGGLGVPDISFALRDITDRLIGCVWSVETLPTDTAYGTETVLRVEHERRDRDGELRGL
jgi:hypothetical protein